MGESNRGFQTPRSPGGEKGVRVLIAALLLGGLIVPADAQDLSSTQIYNGQCTTLSHIAEGGVNEDLTKRRSRYFCDTAVISILDDNLNRVMVQFSEKRSHHGQPIAFAGIRVGRDLKVERVYLTPGTPIFVTEGTCSFFFDKDRLSDAVCGAEIIEEDRKTVVVAIFKVH